ncbi:MAG TPA: response regulator [Pyrinomonadaceae bacterium]|jgi:CheY-like chemotaxis protein
MNDSGRGTPTILIVEDVDWIRGGMRRSVEEHGYRALVAADDAEAAAVAERDAPDVILTEEQLPTFKALLALVRAHPALRHTPVVIVNPDAEDGTRLGDAHVLPDYDRIAALLANSRH